MKASVIWIILFFSIPAQAELFKIVNRQYGAQPQAVVDALFNQLESEVNANLPNADATSYLKGVANATVTSGSGLDADHSSNFKTFIISGRAGVAADLGNNTLTDVTSGATQVDTLGGASSQATVLIGFNLGSYFKKNRGLFNPERIRGYFHFFNQRFSQDSFTANMTAFGGGLQYKVISPYRAKFGWFKFGGIDASVGIRRSVLEASISQQLSESASSGGLSSNFNGTVIVGANVRSWTVPIEISTSARLFYVLSFFGGLGLDSNFGTSNGSTSISGPVTVSSGGVTGDAQLDIGQASGPDSINGRFFAGVAVDLSVFSIHAQYNQSFSNNTVGLNVAANVYW